MRRKARMTKSEALQRESHWVLRDRIRRLPAKPPQERTHFLRKRGGFLFVTVREPAHKSSVVALGHQFGHAIQRPLVG